MKKLFLLISTLFCLSSASNAADLKQGEDSGFGLKLHAGLCIGGFGDTEVDGKTFSATEDGEDVKNTPLFGMSIDNRWYVANPGQFGIGIDARWLDLGIGKSKFSYEGVETSKTTNVEVGMIMPGVVGTFYLDNDMAIDLFYNIGPSVFVQMSEGLLDAATDAQNTANNITKNEYLSDIDGFDDFNNLEDALDKTYFDFGFSHFIGAAFRYKIFQGGVEYNLAKLKRMEWGDGEDTGDFVVKSNRSNLRIFLGFKF